MTDVRDHRALVMVVCDLEFPSEDRMTFLATNELALIHLFVVTAKFKLLEISCGPDAGVFGDLFAHANGKLDAYTCSYIAELNRRDQHAG